MIRFLAIRNLAVIESVAVEFEPVVQHPHRRDRRRQIDPRRSGRPAPRRARLARPGPHRRRHGHRRSDLRDRGRQRADRPPRDHRPGPQPRVHQRRAGHRGGAQGSVAPARRAARPARASAAARSRAASRRCSMRGPASSRSRERGRGRVRERPRRCASSSIACAWTSRERAARLELVAFQLGELSKAGPAARRGRRARGRRGRCCAAPTPSSVCAARATPSSTTATTRCWPASAASGSGSSELAAIDAAVRAVPRAARRHQGAARGPRVHAARLRRRHRRVAGAAAAGRGSPGAARAAQAQARPDARRRRSRGAIALAAEHAALTGGGSTAAELEQRARRRRRRSSRARADALARAGAAAAPKFARRSKRELARAGDGAHAVRGPVRRPARSRKGSGRDAGIDSGEFFLSPNPGEDLRPLARIVSGGELSRVMLALKTLAAADVEPGKTLIFDEVDAGIGGRVATVVGAEAARRSGDRSRCCASRTCRRSPPRGAHPLPDREARARQPDGDHR